MCFEIRLNVGKKEMLNDMSNPLLIEFIALFLGSLILDKLNNMRHTLTIAFLLFSIYSFAQITSGHIKYVLSEVSFEQAEMAQAGAMMQNSTMDIYFTPEQQKTVADMMNGMMKTQSYQTDSSMIQYMDMMGQKIKVVMEVPESAEEAMKDIDIRYDKSDTKEIAGYNCYKASLNIPMPDSTMDDMEMKLYISDEIKMKTFNVQQIRNLKIEGTPLMMVIDAGIMRMTYEAKEVNKEFEKSIFDLPTGAYKTMTLKELESLGMSGF